MQKRSNEDDHDHESSKRTRYSEELTIRPDVSSQISLTSEKGKRTSNLSAPTIQLDGHSGAVYSVAFDSTGQNLASASFDRQILLWDVYGENTNYNVLAGHKNAVLQVKWNQVIPHQLVSCSADKTVAVWDGNKGQCIRKLIEHKSIVNSLDNARNDANLLVSGSDDSSALLWDARSKTSVATMKHQYQVTAVAMRSDGEAVYTGGIDNIIRRFDVRKLGKAVENLQLVGHSDTITGLCLSPDNNFLLSNAMDSSVRKWDVRPFVKQDSGRCVVGYAGAHHGAEKVLLKVNWSNSASSMGNKLVTAGSSDRIVHIWEEDTGKQLYYLPGHKGSVNEVCFHPTEAIVASCSTDKTIFLGELS